MSRGHHALITHDNSLARALAKVLLDRGIRVTLVSSQPDSISIENVSAEDLANLQVIPEGEFNVILDQASSRHGNVSLVFNTWFANPGKDSIESLLAYPQKLLAQSTHLKDHLVASECTPAVINFAFLPAMYVNTPLEDFIPSLRGSITGVTRTLARKWGNSGIRVTCVQAGLTDLPETQAWSSEVLKQVQVPVKRWGRPDEVAKFMVFLAADSLYTTGQTMIIDGGLTAGITGT